MTIKYILLLYMPAVPLYNQGATEEAGLTRAKRRVIKALESGVVKLSNKPDEDLSNGSADVLAEKLIARFQDLTVVFRQINSYYGEAGEALELDSSPEIIKSIDVVITAVRIVTRLLRIIKEFVKVIRFTDLGVLSDVKAAQEECDKEAKNAFDVLFSLDFGELKKEDYEDEPLVDLDEDEDSLSQFSLSRDSPSLDTTRDGSRSYQSQSSLGTLSTRSRARRRAANVLDQLQEMIDEMDDTSSNMSDLSDISSLTDVSVDNISARQQRKNINFKRFSGESFKALVIKMYVAYQEGLNVLVRGYNNFNVFRQQKVLSAQAADADVGNAIKTGKGVLSGGFETIQGTASRFYGVTPQIQNIYRVGGSSNILYEREGLPRFL